MRFRTQIVNSSLMHKIVKSLAVTAKTCVIKLAPETIHFIVAGKETVSEGVQIWSQIKVTTLFDQYRIESRSNNEIYLELHLDGLIRALRSAEAAGIGTGLGGLGGARDILREGDASFKLGKKDDKAVLIFEIKGMSANGNPLAITHDVACVVLPPNRVSELKEPLCPSPDVHIQLPNQSQLRGLAQRLSHLATTVSVSANKQGTLKFSINTDEVELDTQWMKQTIPTFDRDPGSNPQEYSPDHMFQVTIGVKSLMKFLAMNVTNGVTIACICDNFCLIAYVYIGMGDVKEASGVLTIFIPRVEL